MVEQANAGKPGVVPTPKGASASSFYHEQEPTVEPMSKAQEAHYQLAREYEFSKSILALGKEMGVDLLDKYLTRGRSTLPVDEDDPVVEIFQ